ncbi:hypothetical protein [Proteiniphilum sp.]|uniref:hypothetical protein n=1 Tax=Proteiniphilum sp. TaxID=1926877 RepID=UPI002B211A20|nr:hypothetical protein [Proteiniphilum sp.]MEA4916559.1 hypothetical protein [Proteiniphilum sp.]
MLVQLLELYKLIDTNKQKFTDAGLNGDFFIDVYRSQPYEPELYEYFSLPAIFVDYSILGQGKKMPRKVTTTLHVVTDEMPDASNIAEQKTEGLKRFMYNLLLQDIIEGSRLGASTALSFINEMPIDEPVVNYHTQTYEFEVNLRDMISDHPEDIIGEFERLNIYGSLKNHHILNSM